MSNQDRKAPTDAHCDHDHDHDCQTCGAPKLPGLAACTYCQAAYYGVSAGVECPGCHASNEKGRKQCAGCSASLMVQCVFCGAHAMLDQPSCGRCHETFAGALERKKAKEQAMKAPGLSPMAHRSDPSGSQILGSLADILKS